MPFICAWRSNPSDVIVDVVLLDDLAVDSTRERMESSFFLLETQ
jgi:hypothetical protein